MSYIIKHYNLGISLSVVYTLFENITCPIQSNKETFSYTIIFAECEMAI